MPYDPRPVSEGGNRGIDEEFSRKAPKGKFRVIGVDTFDGGDWVEGDYATIQDAINAARSKAGEMTYMHVFDDRGCNVESFGRF